MPTSPPSARALRRPPLHPSNDAGFSLLELVVVLAIMAIMMSLVGTRMINTIESNRFIRTAEAAVADVLILRADAMMSGQPRRLITASSDPALAKGPIAKTLRRYDVPQGWKIEGDTIHISASGVCSGGYLAMTAPDSRKIVFHLLPPKCEPQRVSLGQNAADQTQ